MTLDNGLTVTYEHLPYLHSATAGLWIKTGSANEPREITGISHFLEHLFFKGTPTRTTRQILEPIESRGGQLNAFTSSEYTCLYTKMLDKHIFTGLDVLADILKNSTFAEMEKERNVILEEIASLDDVPEDLVHEILALRMWPDHPLGRSVSGYAATVEAITLDMIKQYYAEWYHPANMYFSIAGNFDVDAVLDQVQREFGQLHTKQPLPRPGAPSFASGIDLVDKDIGQHHFCFGFPGPTVAERRRYVFDVLWCALGGGSTSRLFQKIREDEGLAYSIYTFNSAYFTSGMFGVYAAVAPENFAKTVDMSFEEIRKFRDDGIAADELDLNREHLKGSMLMSLEGSFNRMQRMAKSMMYYGRLLSIDEVMTSLNGVTAEDIAEVSRDIFQPDKCQVVAIGPAEGAPITEIAL
jgi:predicted Zn-dependent peptidase